MVPAIVPTTQLYQLNDHLFRKVLKGLDREALTRHPENANPMIWLAGHVTHARNGLAGMLGIERDTGLKPLFGRHSKVGEPSAYPEISEIVNVWQDVSRQLSARFDRLTEEDLEQPSRYDAPIADKTLRGTITFFSYHESYHIGQMAYVRKWLGLDGLIDG